MQASGIFIGRSLINLRTRTIFSGSGSRLLQFQSHSRPRPQNAPNSLPYVHFLLDVLGSGCRTSGLPNHTVAVWVRQLRKGNPVRMVVPTSQIFFDVTDSFGTRKLNPWRQSRFTSTPVEMLRTRLNFPSRSSIFSSRKLTGIPVLPILPFNS